MSILMDSNTPVIVQGITGRDGQFHTRNMKASGTRIVGGGTGTNADLAMAGGRAPSRLDEALSAVRGRLGLPSAGR